MLGLFWLLQEPWLKYAEQIGGTAFAIICLAIALVCTAIWHAAFFYFKFGALERGLTDVRKQMVTRDALAIAIGELERRLNHWADERFLTRNECLAKCDLCGEPPRRRSSDRS